VLGHLGDLDARFGILCEYARHEVLELGGGLDVRGVAVLNVDNLLHHLAVEGARVCCVLHNPKKSVWPAQPGEFGVTATMWASLPEPTKGGLSF